MTVSHRNSIIESQAAKSGVSKAVHPQDHLFNFLINHPGFASDIDRVRYYFEDGQLSAQKFRQLVETYSPGRKERAVLEFAAGYGCVSRHLIHLPGMRVVSCDIHPEAIEFLEQQIGVPAYQSSRFPEMLSLPRQYDVVFALSFFSHMPLTTWARWLVALSKVVETGGVLLFTTQGLTSRPYFLDPVIPENGFWYQGSSEQADLSTEEYGQTIVTPDFCKANIASVAGLELVEMREAFWWGHQDLYVVRKVPA
jgi:2-polyprenyl-3-methyl-5-hydroxy-6-metoxy-1,4-benzoquinol methylase